MRDIKQWRNKLTRRLRDHWGENAPLDYNTTCDVELGLALHHILMPSVPTDGFWVVLTGYPFPVFEELEWNDDQHQMLGTARHLLPYYRSPFPWQRALRQYSQLDQHLRGFKFDEDGHVIRHDVTICADRFDYYEETLLQPPNFRRQPLTWAEAGRHEYLDGKRYVDVEIPPELIFSPLKQQHPMSTRRHNPDIVVPWDGLLKTARLMDEHFGESSRWEHRLSRVQLEFFDNDDHLRSVTEFTISGMMNLIGMVSSGKTTLITVLSAWAASEGYHITLIVGDVVSALDRASLFSDLGFKVAPILGASNRERHTNRLHRVVQASQPHQTILQQHKGFEWLSTTCALNGLHSRMTTMDINNRPCLNLRAIAADESGDDDEKQQLLRSCPIFSHCSFHQAQHDLVDAQIWIATPASLVYTTVAPQINRERVRFAELMYRRSDLVIVDESDQVQIQLDSIFSPNQTLASKGYSGWFNQLSQQVFPRLNQEGRTQLSEESVEAWCTSHEMAQLAINRVYALLLQEKRLRIEIEQDYFTAWMIFDRLAAMMSGITAEERHENATYREFMAIFETFLNDPIAERVETELALLAERSLTHSDRTRNRERILRWINEQEANTLTIDEDIQLAALLLEFALVVAVLSDRLDNLLRDWKHAEIALQLDGASSIIFHRPPDDYAPVIPVSPMGNVLAFQYIRSGEDNSGDLRFFRCLGVGRWMLLHLNELFAGDGVAGPHVFLFSGTSWAGTSPSCHVQLPVSGILHAPKAEVTAIADDSTFEFLPVPGADGKPIRISGKRGNARFNAMYEMLSHFAKHRGIRGDKPSIFEDVRTKLPNSRQRILILVGSYVEARAAAEHIERVRPDWRGQVLQLVADDDEFESTWQGTNNTLQRGLVHQFAETDGWILVAPLLAVERGHNILNEYDQAAIGAVYFLIRPHPRPDDINYAIQSINHWAVERYQYPHWQDNDEKQLHPVIATGAGFRQAAYSQWRHLLRLPMVYSTLPKAERDAVIWTQLVTIWQVIGRLIRGGSPAHVYFCDAAFALRTADGSGSYEDASSSLLIGIRQVLEPYFDTASPISERDRKLVATLYGPLYQAIIRMKGLPKHV